MAQGVHRRAEWISVQSSHLDTRSHHPISVVERSDGLPASAAHRHAFVAPGDACILMQLPHSDTDGPGSLRNRPTHTARDAVRIDGRNAVVRVVLYCRPVRYRAKLILTHWAVQPEPHDHRTSCGQVLIEGRERGWEVYSPGPVRDRNGDGFSCGPGPQGPGRVPCRSDSQERATRKGRVVSIGSHHCSSQARVTGS